MPSDTSPDPRPSHLAAPDQSPGTLSPDAPPSSPETRNGFTTSEGSLPTILPGQPAGDGTLYPEGVPDFRVNPVAAPAITIPGYEILGELGRGGLRRGWTGEGCAF